MHKLLDEAVELGYSFKELIKQREVQTLRYKL
jgi:hypothetical protein